MGQLGYAQDDARPEQLLPTDEPYIELVGEDMKPDDVEDVVDLGDIEMGDVLGEACECIICVVFPKAVVRVLRLNGQGADAAVRNFFDVGKFLRRDFCKYETAARGYILFVSGSWQE